MRKERKIQPSIVSASYRSDIPAYHARWFAERLREGFAVVSNPYGGAPARIDLRSEAVAGFVFWTRNAAPFFGVLDDLAHRGAPFFVQFTLTGYPKELEPRGIAEDAALAQMKRLRDRFGPDAVVWRYDPILETSLTPMSFHIETFSRIARALEGVANEAVISFADFYRKTRRNLAIAATRHGFAWRDPELAEKRALACDLAAIAEAVQMRLTLCTEPDLEGFAPAACIDAERLGRIAGRAVFARLKGNRPGCLCGESRDIGQYDSCLQGCVYCYAVASEARARRLLGREKRKS